MKSLKLGLVVISSIGLLIFGACSNQTQETTQNSSPDVASQASPEIDHSTPSKGGQVVEAGAYHLEFVAETEDQGTHLDLYLQRGDNHEAIPNAKVTAQIQLPDGTEKMLSLSYDAQGKHYTALLTEKALGQYQVKITSDINGEKVDGRFSFKK